MKIDVTEHERNLIVQALLSVGTLVATTLAAKLHCQDPADNGPEVDILSVEGAGWAS